MKFSTFIPPGELKGALLWLSGTTCTEENFITKAGAQRTLSDLGWMVICPDTSPRGLDLPGEHETTDFGSGASFYVNAITPGFRDHYRMYDYINEEIYGLLVNHFGAPKVGILGHSMGGHGALVIGLRNAFKYASISALAPVANPTASEWGRNIFKGYLGEDREVWATYDATTLIRDAHRHPKTLLIDQGLADELLEPHLFTKNFESACRSMQQSAIVNYREGYDHSYYFVASFIESHIRFHAQ